MLLADLVNVSDEVASTRSRTAKITALSDTLARLSPEEAPVAVSYLTGKPTQRRLGAGYATVYGVEADPVGHPGLEILEVEEILDELAATSGPGSKARREQILSGLFGRATPAEQDFLRGLMVKNLRQGALEGVMAEAVAKALGVEPDRVRRAAMLEGDLVKVASRALAEGPSALGAASLSLLTPVQPMLAKTAATAAEAISAIGEAVVERKLDGLRVQVHRWDRDVVVFSRNLRDITSETPGIVAQALAMDADRFILDGEGLSLDREGRPLAFQDTMSKPGDGATLLAAYYFDVLHVDGDDLIDMPLLERRRRLEALVDVDHRVESIVTADEDIAEDFFDRAVESGFEGVVVKDPNQPYEAGRRGSGWLKVKPTHTLDLVVLAAEWGSGRREGWLSNLHLGARDPEGGFVMLGKTFKGLTDEMLTWQTEAFLAIEEKREGHIVHLRPEIVYEIAFDGVQRSTRYPGGVALRFARVKRHRQDKEPADADTIETVRSFAR